MNNENVVVKQKNNKGVIVLLILVIVGLIGFVAYDKSNKSIYNNKSQTNQVSNKDEVKEEKTESDFIGYYNVTTQDTDTHMGLNIYLALYKNNAVVVTDLSVSPVQYIGGYEFTNNNIIVNSKWMRASQEVNSYENIFTFNAQNEYLQISSSVFGYTFDEMLQFKKITKDVYENDVYSIIPKSVNQTE